MCKKHPHSVDARQTQLYLQGTANDGEAKVTTWNFDQNAIRKALARMIIVDELPFKFVEHAGFRNFIEVACPRFKIPSRFTISRDCFQLYLDERSKMKEFFISTKQRVCLTTDTWTSLQRINYMCLTAHFIDTNWVLHKRILNFCPITSHKGTSIGHAIERCLIDWGIERVFTITVDNASSNDVAVDHVKDQLNKWGFSIMGGEFLHMRCVAHIINLVVGDGLKDMDASIVRIRAAVRYVRQSPSRIQRFNECVALEKIESKCMLCLDVSTRWNSTYLMLDAAQKYEMAFKRFEIVDPFFVSELSQKHGVPNSDDGCGVPNKDDWEACRRLVSILKHFYDLTLIVSGYRHVTSNIFFEEMCGLECFLKELQDGDDIDNSLMANEMMKKYKKYWGVSENDQKTNILIFIACVLDPRYKFGYVSFTLEETYGRELGGGLGKRVKDNMYAMFYSYVKLLAPQSHGQRSVQNKSSSSVGGVDQSMDHVDATKKKKKERMVRYKMHKIGSGEEEKQSELDKYLSEACEDDDDDFDILDWWKQNCHRFPILSQMARDVLAVPISTVASESAFSTGGRVLDCFRSSLTPKIVQSLICAQDWLRDSSTPTAIEEDLHDIEKIEEGN